MSRDWRHSRYDNYDRSGREVKNRDKHRQEKHLRDALKANNVSEIIQLDNDEDVKQARRLSQQDVDDICLKLDLPNDERNDIMDWEESSK